MSDYNKLSSEIFNAEQNNLEKLASLFPASVKDGAVDFAALREELGQFEEVSVEKYELTWAGKQNAKKATQSDIAGRTLKYIPDDSKDAETTQNLYIEGDNLEVLKLLRQNYYGAIKMIYIDPPYNTGSDFIYRDDFSITQAESDEAEGETVDGERMIVNQKSNNRYHANWLNMMYPRLRIAKDLLSKDGIIFISIDDTEVDNLKKICNEVFDEQNFVACLPTIMNLKGNNDEFGFAGTHEFTIVYMKNKLSTEDLNGLDLTGDDKKEYDQKDEIGYYKQGATLIRTGEAGAREQRPKGYYPIYVNKNLEDFYLERKNKTDFEVFPKSSSGKEMSWRRSKEFLSETKSEIIIKKTTTGISFYKKQRLEEDMKNGKKAKTLFYKPEYSSGNGTAILKSIFNERLFDNPKPVSLIKDIVKIGTNQNDVVLDFFSGSATTAHAVMQLNAEDRGNRKFIMVQLPETCDEKSEAAKARYKNICEIGKERIRRSGDKIKSEIEAANAKTKLSEEPKQVPDIGFKVFRVANTNIRWTHEVLKKQQVEIDESMLSDKEKLDFMPGCNDINIVYEILLRQSDIPLSSEVEKLNIGNRTYLFADAYVVCLDDNVTKEMVEEMAAIEPTPIKYVFRDSAFNDDISLKDETVRRLEAYIARNNSNQKKAYAVEFI